MTPVGRALNPLPPLFVVARVASSTREGVTHIIMGTPTGQLGCSCESGRFRPDRECRHLRALYTGENRPALTAEGFTTLKLV